MHQPRNKNQVCQCLMCIDDLCMSGSLLHRLLKHLDAFIKAAAGELCPYIGELLCEIFSGGPSITLSVKTDQIWKLMWLIFTRGKENFSHTNTALMDALIELLMVFTIIVTCISFF